MRFESKFQIDRIVPIGPLKWTSKLRPSVSRVIDLGPRFCDDSANANLTS